ncbi:hypothetical protein [Phyllobacterium sp. P5_D12]
MTQRFRDQALEASPQGRIALDQCVRHVWRYILGCDLTEILSGKSTHYDMEEKMDLHDLRDRLAKVNEDAEALVRDIQEMLALGKTPGSRAWTAMCNGMVMRYQNTIQANEEVMSRIDHHLISAGD